jgi:hypothetical protein
MLVRCHAPRAVPRVSLFLRAVWQQSAGGVFAELFPQEQWYLHDYFRPSEQLSDQALLAHRKEISARRPSLPQRAGRALKFLQAVLATSLNQYRQFDVSLESGYRLCEPNTS